VTSKAASIGLISFIFLTSHKIYLNKAYEI
jgi:hypothetical protein